MKRKIKSLTCCVLFVSFLLTGCGVMELTDKESDLIARYSAGALLNHSDSYEGRLVVSSEATAAPEITNAPEETPMPEATLVPEESAPPESIPGEQPVEEPEETPIPQVALNEIYGLEGITVAYSGYEFCREYSEKSSAYQIMASDDEILLVVKFHVSNTASEKKKVNLINRQISYLLSADDSQYKPTISVLENGGLNFLETKIPAGKSEEAVLIYAIPKKVRDAQALSIAVQENAKVSIVTVR